MKELKEKLNKLGIHSFEDGSIGFDEIKLLENRLGEKLPLDYKWFLNSFGECDFEEWAEFPTEGGGVAPGTFFGKGIIGLYEDYLERLPKKCIPINDDGASNLIILSLRKKDYGFIYFQNHSYGAENLEDRMYHLSNSFTKFIIGLEIDE